jgi:hypothetical protein
MIDFPVTARTLSYAQVQALSFHLAFHSQEPLFEQLVTGRVHLWLNYLYSQLSLGNSHPIAASAVDEYVRAYRRPHALRHVSRYYQTWPQDEINNRASLANPLTIPVHLVAQAPLFDSFLAAMRDAAPEATGPPFHTGHWMMHEAPRQVLSKMSAMALAARAGASRITFLSMCGHRLGRLRAVAAAASVDLCVMSVATSCRDHFHGMSLSPRARATTALVETSSRTLSAMAGTIGMRCAALAKPTAKAASVACAS